jgi:hypothetical protein
MQSCMFTFGGVLEQLDTSRPMCFTSTGCPGGTSAWDPGQNPRRKVGFRWQAGTKKVQPEGRAGGCYGRGAQNGALAVAASHLKA